MSDLLEKFLNRVSDSEVRNDAIDNIKSIGLPTNKTERWKYSSLKLRLLEKKSFAQIEPLNDIDTSTCPTLANTCHIKFENGSINLDDSVTDHGITIEPLDTSLLPMHDYKKDKDVFAFLNVSQANQAWHIKVTNDQTIMLSILTSDNYNGISYPQLFIDVAPDVTLTLYDFHYDYGNGMINLLQNIHVNEGAKVVHIISKDNNQSFFIQRCDVDVDKNATYNCHILDTGGSLNKQDINVNLTDDDASCVIHGVGVMGNKDHSDWRTKISHVHPNTTSSESFRILAHDTGVGCFNGKIHIYRGADNSHSSLETGNLLSGDNARVNIKPELEIYAEEVTASHGATVGQIDENSLFYLRSRGMPIEEAKSLLKYAFLAEPLQNISNDNAKEVMLELLRKKCSSLENN